MAWLAQLFEGVPRLLQLTGRFFEHLRVDEAWDETIAERARKGPVVFVLRTVSLVDAIALGHVARRSKLPPIGFAQDLPWLPPAIGGGAPGPRLTQEQALVRALEAKKTAILFLKRRPSVMSRTGRATSEGDDVLRALIAHCREQQSDVTLIPVTLLWTLRSERARLSPLDVIFGTTDMPGDLRAAVQLLTSYEGGVLRVGRPTSVLDFLAAQEPESAEYTLVRRLTYALISKVERERRSVVGPVRKSPGRIRDEVLRSPRISTLVTDLSGGDAGKRSVTLERARAILQELAAEPNPDVLRGLEQVIDRLVSRVFSGVDVEPSGVERVREAARAGTVVLLPSHKSHVDYLVLSYVLRKNLLELPVVAAGDNLAFFPVGELLRRSGAFFIRRDFRGDRLYAAVIDAYVRRLLRDGWAIEFFFEGGRSRTGKLLTPKLGLLHLVVDAALSTEGRPVTFIPVSIGYERMMEDFELAQEKAGARKERESVRSLVAVVDALKHDYGRVAVSFGEPIDLAALRAELGLGSALPPAKRRAITNRLAARVVRGIHQATLITAGALVATALLDMPGRGLSHQDLVTQCGRLYVLALRAGATPSPSLTHGDGRVREAAIRDAALVFSRGKLLMRHVADDTLGRDGDGAREPREGEDVVYAVREEARSRLDLVKNGVLHFFADRALVSLAYFSARSRSVARARLFADATELGRMLAHDLIHFSDGPLEARVDETVRDMIALGELTLTGDVISLGPGNEGGDARAWLLSHASHLVPTVEAYRVAARTLRVLLGEPRAQKQLASRALKVGRDMFLGGEIDRREALSAPTIHAAFEAFLERGLLERDQAGYKLSPSATREAVRSLEVYFGAAVPGALAMFHARSDA